MPALTLDGKVSHDDILAFAGDRVNLKAVDVEEYRDQVRRLRERLETYINDHHAFDLVKMLNAGSVAKGTALRTINDMDVAVYVEAARAPSKEPDLLGWLKDRLREAYDGILKPDQITVQHHCVTISFRGTGLDVDVVPVLYEGEADDYGYLIAKDTGDRVRTSVKLHLAFTRKRKTAHANFAQLVRLVKWWVRLHKLNDPDFRFKSFLVELIIAHLVDRGLDCSHLPSALEAVFGYIVRSELREVICFSDFLSAGKPSSEQSAMRIYDPVNAQNNVAGRYSDRDRQRIVEAAQEAFDAVVYARTASTKAISIEQWRDVFGPGFTA